MNCKWRVKIDYLIQSQSIASILTNVIKAILFAILQGICSSTLSQKYRTRLECPNYKNVRFKSFEFKTLIMAGVIYEQKTVAAFSFR